MNSSVPGQPSFRDALRIKEFRWLWLADTQSALGDQLTRVAVTVLVFSQTASALLTSITFAMSYLPSLIGGVLLAGLADQQPRRRVLVTCDLIRAGLVLAIAIPGMPIGVTWALIAFTAVISSLFESADNATIPDVLPNEIYPVATGLRTISHQLSTLAGFAVGGVVVSLVGSRVGLLLDALTFLISAGLLRSKLQSRPAVRTAAGSVVAYAASIGGSGRTLFGDPRLRLLAILIWMSALYSVQEGVAAPYAKSVGAGSYGLGLLLAATPAGAAVGAFYVSRMLSADRRTPAMWVLALLGGLPLIVCALKPGLAMSLALFALSGFLSAYFVQAISLFTLRVPVEMRGQVIGLAAAILLTAQGLAMPAAGVLVGYVGAARAVALMGAGGMVIAAYLRLRWVRLGTQSVGDQSVVR